MRKRKLSWRGWGPASRCPREPGIRSQLRSPGADETCPRVCVMKSRSSPLPSLPGAVLTRSCPSPLPLTPSASAASQTTREKRRRTFWRPEWDARARAGLPASSPGSVGGHLLLFSGSCPTPGEHCQIRGPGFVWLKTYSVRAVSQLSGSWTAGAAFFYGTLH